MMEEQRGACPDQDPTAESRQEEDAWIHEWMRSGRPISALATLGIGMAAAVLATLAPQIEGLLFPVFSANDIPMTSVSRDGDRLCWTRIGMKARDLQLIDIDADVDYISNKTGRLAHQPTPEILDAESGEPITTDDALPAGKPYELRRCLKLSPHILPGQPIRLRQVAYYQSPTGLYNVPVTVPTITVPADKAWVFSQKHDSAPTPDDSAVAGPKSSALGQRSDADTLDDVRKGMAEMERPTPDSDAPKSGRFPVHMDTTLSEQDAERVEQSRQEHGDRSRRDALRRLIPRGLDGEDRDALRPYDPRVK